jgi:hypothetical protein
MNNITRSPQLVYHEGRRIGSIVGNEFQQTRRPNNFLRWGIALDPAILNHVMAHGATIARIRNGETGEEYVTGLATLQEKGRKVNYGYGDQLVLPFGYWTIAGAAPAATATPAVKTQETDDAQLPLFGGVA